MSLILAPDLEMLRNTRGFILSFFVQCLICNSITITVSHYYHSMTSTHQDITVNNIVYNSDIFTYI